ncbi:MAG: AAA family ATPase [Defluviitaleaceae bacterium]|nr:AAA family ATPase [Defluviitaleaceae bacterium]
MARELSYDQLKNHNIKDYLKNVVNTKEVKPSEDLIGQDRAEKALKFGLSVKSKGYNIYVSGLPGSGKSTFAKRFAEELAANEPAAPDMCYVYNFDNPKRPNLFMLNAGIGKEFADDMEDMINSISEELQKVFSSRDFEDQKTAILKKYNENRDEKIKEMAQEAKAYDFGIKSTNAGMYFMPILDGVAVTEEQYDELSEDEKERINKNSAEVSERAALIMRDIKEYEKQIKTEIDDLEYSTSLFVVGRYVGLLLDKYGDNSQIIKYLQEIKEDILENIEEFVVTDNEEEDTLAAMLPWYTKKSGDFLSRYAVNVLVDNSETKGAPVVVEYNPIYSNLVGDIEYDSEYGNFTTDFMKIKAGVLHKANGGYLIIQAADLFASSFAWDGLKRVLRTGEINIEPLREYSTGVAMSGVRPEPAKVNVKVIIVGTPFYYGLIYEYDDDFQKLFKIRADFDYEMEFNKPNVVRHLGFIKKQIEKHGCLDFEIGAISHLLEFSSRLSERQDKLSAQFDKIAEILLEANAWAKLDSKNQVTGDYVIKAIDERRLRLNMYEEKLGQMIEEHLVMIETKGEKIGQINGLAVLDLGDYAFAKPSRITATTYMGRAGIVNIEKEAEMSGAIHNKGVQVMAGYLGYVFAQDFPLSLSCRVCFEQNYSGIDGDSASSTELYAILSSLSELPINQGIAVTGSINQFGEIQPIGGVTYKVEGFFDVCNKRGLTGKQGVIIPWQNAKELVLNDEVIEAVKNSLFHIYPIAHVNEGIEILTGTIAGDRNEKGNFPIKSVHGKVFKKLKKFHKKAVLDN